MRLSRYFRPVSPPISMAPATPVKRRRQMREKSRGARNTYAFRLSFVRQTQTATFEQRLRHAGVPESPAGRVESRVPTPSHPGRRCAVTHAKQEHAPRSRPPFFQILCVCVFLNCSDTLFAADYDGRTGWKLWSRWAEVKKVFVGVKLYLLATDGIQDYADKVADGDFSEFLFKVWGKQGCQLLISPDSFEDRCPSVNTGKRL